MLSSHRRRTAGWLPRSPRRARRPQPRPPLPSRSTPPPHVLGGGSRPMRRPRLGSWTRIFARARAARAGLKAELFRRIADSPSGKQRAPRPVGRRGRARASAVRAAARERGGRERAARARRSTRRPVPVRATSRSVPRAPEAAAPPVAPLPHRRTARTAHPRGLGLATPRAQPRSPPTLWMDLHRQTPPSLLGRDARSGRYPVPQARREAGTPARAERSDLRRAPCAAATRSRQECAPRSPEAVRPTAHRSADLGRRPRLPSAEELPTAPAISGRQPRSPHRHHVPRWDQES